MKVQENPYWLMSDLSFIVLYSGVAIFTARRLHCVWLLRLCYQAVGRDGGTDEKAGGLDRERWDLC